MSETKRERVLRLIREVQNRTTDRGCTPAEAATAAALVAKWVEQYQIDEAELRAASGRTDPGDPDAPTEVRQDYLRTGKKTFNPGWTRVVDSLATAMCCKVVLLHLKDEAVYGIVGDTLDTNYVCQMSITLVPQLLTMARLEGAEHGYEKAGLVRWSNQYLCGAAVEIRKRIEADRKERSRAKEASAARTSTPGAALAVITGESLAVVKKAAAEEAFRGFYPKTRTTTSRADYDHTAHSAGREAGKRVGLNIAVGGKGEAPRLK